MKKTLKIRLYPDKKEEAQFLEFSNIARFVYNETLAFSKEFYKNTNKYPTLQEMIDHIKELKYGKFPWILNAPEAVTKQAIKDLRRAFQNYFSSRGNYPKFKKKNKTKLSFYQRVDNFRKVDENHVKLTGIKSPVKIKKQNLPNHVYNPRVTYDGKFWYISLSFEVECKEKKETSKIMGIDLGIKNTITTSSGETYGNVNKTKEVKLLEKRKKREQRKLSNKYEMNKQGKKFIKTKNIIKLEKKIKLIDRKLKNIRNTYRHTITKMIIKQEPSVIIIEDLNVSGMLKNKHLSDSIRKQGFNDIVNKLKYKCELNGIELKMADRFYPSSKKCSKCGNLKQDLKLSDRTYNCNYCGLKLDRDINAAINLKNCFN